ncbi:hypothetical protein, partial [Bradyrhizobium sp.]|uniref:hypothetical protein n=1 Tax=Bradyrhizobium sp. TaxID=376 RepID=UPI003C44ED03
NAPFLAASCAACEEGCVADEVDVDCAVVVDAGCRSAVCDGGFLRTTVVGFGAVTSTLGSSIGAFPPTGASAVCARTAAFEPSSNIAPERRRMSLSEDAIS